MNDLVRELTRRLTRLNRGRGGAALGVWGEAGSGKTWAVREARRTLPLRSAEVSARHSPAQALAALPRPAHLPPWLDTALRRAAHGDLDDAAAGDALAALLGVLAPFVLHVEDLHDAPEGNARAWLAVAARVVRTDGAGVIMTSRTPPPEGLGALRTAPLTPDQTRALLERDLGAALPAAAAGWIHAHTHGNALFTLEYLRFLVRQGHLYSDGQRWHWRAPHAPGTGAPLPPSVEALILHLLHSAPLSEAARRAWEALTLWPPDAPPGVWADLGAQVAGVPGPQWPVAVAELHRAGLLRGEEIAHPLYREVAAAHAPPDVRRTLAARAVTALEARDPLLAAPFVPDAALAAPRALDVLRRAAAAALEGGQPRRAAECVTWALSAATGDERTALALHAARLWRPLDPVRAGELAGEVLRREPGHVEATFLLAGALVVQGDEERAATLVGQLEDAGGPAWFAQHVTLYAEQHRYPAVLELWSAHPEWQGDAPPAVSAAVGRALDFTGRSPEALALLDAALARPLDPLDGAALRMARCRARYNAGQLRAAEADATAMIDVARAAELRPDLARALSSRATIRDTLGAYAGALADAEESLSVFSALGVARDHAQQQTRLACLLLEYGESERAESLLHEGRRVLRRAGPTHFLALAEMNLAYLYLEQQPPHAGALALQYAHAGVHNARQAGSPLIVAQALGMAARAEAQHGHADRALDLAREAHALTAAASTHDAAWSTWALGFALEAGGDTAGALTHFRAAAAQLDHLQLGLWADRLGLEADRVAGDDAAAARKLARFRAQHLQNWVQVTQRYFPHLGGGHPDGAPAAPPAEPEAAAHLRVLGPVQVWRGGQRVAFRSPLGRALLALLLEARLDGRPGVGPLDAQRALYPHLPDEQAAAALHQLIYRTRQALGADLVVLTDHGYALGPLDSDAERFLRGGDTALWRGALLEDTDSAVRLGPLADRLYAALRARAAVTDDVPERARIGRLLLAEQPLDPDVLRWTLDALHASAQARAARALLAELRERYAEVGERLPEWATPTGR
ncbi:tetratricopeptide (TPR) repeat protein [Deinococcus metalli]|uniref:Tetratricopeptide (TPR) repeat protein n=1 Tax=Deinococcus metalli TaxID=1141878 RepID=A0A7W8KDC0_9DEIO|nr:hypothetical protein [Deinococcus metalli]MBB5376097.1 tetratricopeptide (TPR) repeat protein [Deinococcus metalli]GHF40816.1 hypothetical protein GCM10017781_16860 [Deinococcus metalli]